MYTHVWGKRLLDVLFIKLQQGLPRGGGATGGEQTGSPGLGPDLEGSGVVWSLPGFVIRKVIPFCLKAVSFT